MGRHKFQLYLTIVTFCTGFLIATSIETTKLLRTERMNDQQFQQETQLNERILAEKEQNRQLEDQLLDLQRQVGKVEEAMAQRKSEAAAILSELEAARMMAGVVPVEGPGVVVTMQDSQNAASSADVTNYIVHEQDVRLVVNELRAAGAEAISINGQRLVSNSSIRCVGPTIIVNGIKSAAPFVITAIGDPNTLESALNLPGGVLSTLRDFVQIEVAKKDKVVLPAFVGDAKTKHS
ncbi:MULTISPECIES: DUF881 domain-containing protein [Bacillales]|jgi:uncharacterized protein YlxW (UPF0749 family)|uniref:DUF881 domain-containing protein n=1 Tax=Brevibacillus aydinogluensis TaxID=927786 RepID=A0AA48M645_9BACL|nr:MULTISPECIES: DUF881 domain-containing protein [Bacillales]NNV01538.1 DUF881 domain-containing protein [Brevibacillus sp. MCWH]UFJ61187.1 DUF881 domain-containing protein [Anoxybacillus sediminis]CAJ1001976.1 DUF881 domain-containing protein [Brevibacillus aydinogluensis]